MRKCVFRGCPVSLFPTRTRTGRVAAVWLANCNRIAVGVGGAKVVGHGEVDSHLAGVGKGLDDSKAGGDHAGSEHPGVSSNEAVVVPGCRGVEGHRIPDSRRARGAVFPGCGGWGVGAGGLGVTVGRAQLARRNVRASRAFDSTGGMPRRRATLRLDPRKLFTRPLSRFIS